MTVAGVTPALQDALRQYFGFDQFKGNQQAIIQSILSGKDTFVIMPTGGGKSLCYQLPAIMNEGTAIVISPLIALMKNQVDLVRSYSSIDNIAHFLNSQLNKAQIKQVKDDITAGKTKILYVAPESLVKEEYLDFLRGVQVSFVAVDEAHCISEWGHDFRPEYRNIRKMIQNIGMDIPVMALTATATPKVRVDIMKSLQMQDPVIFISSFLRDNLYYEMRPKMGKEETIKDITKYIKSTCPGQSGIIYCLSRKTTEEVAEMLSVNGINAVAYHAGLDTNTRSDRQDKFLMEDVQVIVATIAFGMGIDKPDVRFVIHFDIPKSLENYYQETGRAGRDGLTGNCIAYFSPKDILKLEKFMRDKPVNEREIGVQHLMEMEAYAETSECRKEFILHYFGEEHTCKRKGMCENCRFPREQREAMEDIILVLKAVTLTNEQSAIPQVLNILVGRKVQDIASSGHDKLEIFGAGKSKDQLWWSSVIRKALLDNLIRKDIEQFGVLKMMAEGKKFMTSPHSMLVSLNHNFSNTDSSDDDDFGGTASKSNALDNTLLGMLKDIRKSVAKKKNVPPYVVFQDPSLEDMATQYPITIEELSHISGVNAGKAQRYGEEFVKHIQAYVEENDIDRPSDFVMKSVANKSAQKVAIIQSIDRQIPLEDISRSHGLTMPALLQEIESIVYSGTRLNLSYYINNKVDEDTQEIIFDYFMESESDSLDAAYKELKEEDVEQNEIRLVRVKFISEMAN